MDNNAVISGCIERTLLISITKALQHMLICLRTEI